jgi:hypothetical protein
MSKVKHTTFRNSNLFCTHCGGEQVVPYPINPEMFSAMVGAFNKIHGKCEKTWVEGSAPKEKTERERAEWWLQHGERGTSSETIWGRMMGMRIVKHHEDHPYDPDDFSRCYKLLKAIPEWRSKLDVMNAVSPTWKRLVENWDKLTEMYEENERTKWKNYKEIGMYEFMLELRGEK